MSTLQVVKFVLCGAVWWSRRDTVDDPTEDPDDWLHDDDTEMGTCDDSAQTQVIAAGRAKPPSSKGTVILTAGMERAVGIPATPCWDKTAMGERLDSKDLNHRAAI